MEDNWQDLWYVLGQRMQQELFYQLTMCGYSAAKTDTAKSNQTDL
jgi:hypothetical protein